MATPTTQVSEKKPSLQNGQEKKTEKKKISLALQGGGSHGAFTWGVLDALLEQKDLEIEGVSGTSAGAMNAISIVQGLVKNGNQGARESLKTFWDALGEQGAMSPLQFNPFEKLTKKFSLSSNPFFHMMNFIGQMFSPYQLNPLNVHPMREMVEKLFDFKLIRSSTKHKLFLCATHIATGKLRVFKTDEIDVQTLLASACVPQLFQAIEVNGEFYWDGGFIGNPAIYPLINGCETPDILVIQIRRVYSHGVPTTVREINNRLGEITQNSCLTREFRAISFITDLIEQGVIPKGKLKKLNMHLIRDDAFFGSLDRETGFSADPDFIAYLFEQGRQCAKKWIKENYEFIGKKTTVSMDRDFVNED